jgi:hypothetical protein
MLTKSPPNLRRPKCLLEEYPFDHSCIVFAILCDRVVYPAGFLVGDVLIVLENLSGASIETLPWTFRKGERPLFAVEWIIPTAATVRE